MFDYNEGVYKIVIKLQINGKVEIRTLSITFNKHAHVVSDKWKDFYVSHVIEVCSYRGDNSLSIVNTVHTIMSYKHQYMSLFFSVSYNDYWLK